MRCSPSFGGGGEIFRDGVIIAAEIHLGGRLERGLIGRQGHHANADPVELAVEQPEAFDGFVDDDARTDIEREHRVGLGAEFDSAVLNRRVVGTE